MRKHRAYLFLLILVAHNIMFGQVIGVRVGGGLGLSLYTGNQMDDKISLSTRGVSELNQGKTLQVHVAINDRYELSAKYLATSLWSFKSKDMLGLSADVEEVGCMLQRSLNDNIKIDDRPYTINVFAGIGACQFRSAFYDYSIPNNVANVPISSIGYGNAATISGRSLPEKLIQPILICGFSIGFRLTSFMTVYFENSFSTTNSNKISGNLFRKNSIPPDGYTFHAITLYLNPYKFGSSRRLGCPKF